jgi:hypothetical protein
MVKKSALVGRRRLRAGCVGAASLLVLAACGGDTAPEATGGQTRTEATNATEAFPEEITAEDFAPELFGDDSADVDNEYFPFEPGSQWTLEGRAFDGEERIERRVVFTVTDLTKVIAGVRAVVGWDRDYNNDELAEEEIIFFAQDRGGNVWHLGQYREEYDEEDGELAGTRAWFVGSPEGATPGIMMKADPAPGTPSYSQGFAPPPFNWDDRSKVHRVGVETCVPVRCFQDVLVIDEFEPTKPGAHQLKYYAPGVGNVRVGWYGEAEKEREVMVLTKLSQLSPEELADARAKALEMEERAYAYGRTQPVEPRAAL